MNTKKNPMTTLYAPLALLLLGSRLLFRLIIPCSGNERMEADDLTWTCHICGKVRFDADISVRKTDIGDEHGLPPGCMTQNVRYCNDRQECIEKSVDYSFFKKQGE